MRPDRERLAGRHRDPLQLSVDVETRLDTVDAGGVDLELGGVQHQAVQRRIDLGDLELDHHRTGEGRRVEIWFEANLVAGRQSVAWQAMGVDHPRDTTPGSRFAGLASRGCETRAGRRARADPARRRHRLRRRRHR